MKIYKKLKSGYTLLETMVAVSLTSMVVIPVLSTHLWCGESWILCGKKGWSQKVAMNSSARIQQSIRGASDIVDHDPDGRWITLAYPDGAVKTLAYTNSPTAAGGWAIGLFETGKNTQWYFTAGASEIMAEQSDPGVFTIPNNSTNSVNVQYRVSQPSANGIRDVNDKKYAVKIRFITALRNAL